MQQSDTLNVRCCFHRPKVTYLWLGELIVSTSRELELGSAGARYYSIAGKFGPARFRWPNLNFADTQFAKFSARQTFPLLRGYSRGAVLLLYWSMSSDF